MMGLSIVVPAYNEQENLGILVENIFNTALAIDALEIVIVDDCSSDNTRAVCIDLTRKYAAVTYIRHIKQSGQSAAVYSGVKHAKHTLIATIDGDGQNPPSEIAKLLNAYLAHKDPNTLFAGHRQQRKDTWVKRLSSRIANRIRSSFLKDDCPDTGCGLKLFHKATFMSLPHFNHMHRFLPALYKRHGGQVINVPIYHKERLHGISKYNTLGRLKVGIVDLFGVAWLARRPCNPFIEEISHDA